MSLSLWTFVAFLLFPVSCVNKFPFEFLPITYNPWLFPSESLFLDIYVASPPAAICFASVTASPDSFITCVGIYFGEFVPFPNW